MRTKIYLCILALISAFSIRALAEEKETGKTIEIGREEASQSSLKELKPYPLPTKTEKRIVIHVAPTSDESLQKVELVVGKIKEIDCNRHGLTESDISDVGLKGWGYPLFKAHAGDKMTSTRMACPDNKLEKAFVSGKSILIRYNSRLPIVIYTEPDTVIQYRLWSASEFNQAE
jgi:ecotin